MTGKLKIVLLLMAIGVLQLVVFDLNQRSGSVLSSIRRAVS